MLTKLLHLVEQSDPRPDHVHAEKHERKAVARPIGSLRRTERVHSLNMKIAVPL